MKRKTLWRQERKLTCLHISRVTRKNDFITFVSKEIKPTEVTWYITKENIAIAHGDFPATSGNAGNITNNNITVTWFDNDDSNKISVDDQIRVHKADNALEGCKIRLIYVVTGDTISIQSFTA